MVPPQAGKVCNAFTVDVEDYFQVEAFAAVIREKDWELYPSRVEGNTNRILDILGEHGVKGTFFILGWIAERFPGIVKRISGEGHEVACHGYSHRPISRMSLDEFRADLRKSKRILEDASCQPVKGYRAPTFSISPEREWAFAVLAEEGFLYDSSVFPIRHDMYGWRSFSRHVVRRRENIIEFPMSTVRILGVNLPFSGGGYLRLLPLALIRAAFRSVNILEKKPVVLYVHPWEIDPDQPRVPVKGLSAFRHYNHLGKTEHKLRNLLKGFSFGRMDEILNEALLRK